MPIHDIPEGVFTFLSSIAAAAGAWIYRGRKMQREVDAQVISNLQESLEFYYKDHKIMEAKIDRMTEEATGCKERIKDLEKEISYLSNKKKGK